MNIIIIRDICTLGTSQRNAIMPLFDVLRRWGELIFYSASASRPACASYYAYMQIVNKFKPRGCRTAAKKRPQ